MWALSSLSELPNIYKYVQDRKAQKKMLMSTYINALSHNGYFFIIIVISIFSPFFFFIQLKRQISRADQ